MKLLVAMLTFSLVAFRPSSSSNTYTDESIKHFTDEANTISALKGLYKLDGNSSPSSLGGRTLFEGVQMVEKLLESILAVAGDGFRVLFYVGCGGKGLNARAAINELASRKAIKTRKILLDIVEIPNDDGSHGTASFFGEIDILDKQKKQNRNDCKEAIAFIHPKLLSHSNVTYSYLLDTNFCTKVIPTLNKDSLSTGSELDRGKNWYLIQAKLKDRFEALFMPNTKLVIEGAIGDGFEGDKAAPVPFALTEYLNSLIPPIDHLDNVLGVSQTGKPTEIWTIYNERGEKMKKNLSISNPRNVIQLYPRQSTATAKAVLNVNVTQCGLEAFIAAITVVANTDAPGLIGKLTASSC